MSGCVSFSLVDLINWQIWYIQSHSQGQTLQSESWSGLKWHQCEPPDCLTCSLVVFCCSCFSRLSRDWLCYTGYHVNCVAAAKNNMYESKYIGFIVPCYYGCVYMCVCAASFQQVVQLFVETCMPNTHSHTHTEFQGPCICIDKQALNCVKSCQVDTAEACSLIPELQSSFSVCLWIKDRLQCRLTAGS